MDPLEHFVRIARAGKFRGCSSGEAAARQLALAIPEHAPSLDGQACEGACEFLVRAQAMPDTARRAINAEGRAG